ncbi:hypothetical protein EAH68_12855 [Corynebacterium hylobatis]|uniref:Uncharacterized protein n=1 Tax=Corynebacterium hylobatis TaxID=1859290 RepID=A0A3S0BEX0_9CORY|nr:hypothetical protein EAH68_12855 [Corynebacterium hylobatis]
MGEALGGLLGDIIGGIGAAIAGFFDPEGVFGAVGEGISTIRDGMEDLHDRVDLVDEILDYGVAYMPTGRNFSGAGKLPFTGQRTPLKGVRLESSGLRLLGKGAWQISVTLNPSWVRLVTSQIIYEIRCYAPNGSLFTYQRFVDYTSDDTHSVDFGADFVVPAPNYLVSVHVVSIGLGRGHNGGWATTRLVAKRWTSETIGQPSGDASEEVGEG